MDVFASGSTCIVFVFFTCTIFVFFAVSFVVVFGVSRVFISSVTFHPKFGILLSGMAFLPCLTFPICSSSYSWLTFSVLGIFFTSLQCSFVVCPWLSLISFDAKIFVFWLERF